MKLEFSQQIFEKLPNIKVTENPSSGSRDVPCGRAERHEETKSRFSQPYERAYEAQDDLCFTNFTRHE